MFFIEFMGIPGAGKSTLKRHLVSRFRQRGRCVYDMNDALLFSLRKKCDDRLFCPPLKFLPDGFAKRVVSNFFKKSSSKFAAQNRFLAQYGSSFQAFLSSNQFDCMPFEEKVSASSWFLGGASVFQIINEELSDNEIVVFDEGFLQRTLSLFVLTNHNKYKFRPDSLLMYLNNIPLPNLVIMVHSDIEGCKDRIFSRERGATERLLHADSKTISAFLFDCKEHFNDVSAWMEKRGKTVIHVFNDKSEKDAVAALWRSLQELNLSGQLPQPFFGGLDP